MFSKNQIKELALEAVKTDIGISYNPGEDVVYVDKALVFEFLGEIDDIQMLIVDSEGSVSYQPLPTRLYKHHIEFGSAGDLYVISTDSDVYTVAELVDLWSMGADFISAYSSSEQTIVYSFTYSDTDEEVYFNGNVVFEATTDSIQDTVTNL